MKRSLHEHQGMRGTQQADDAKGQVQLAFVSPEARNIALVAFHALVFENQFFRWRYSEECQREIFTETAGLMHEG
ncbi:hypothetical protein [Paraburkholderia sp. BCC1885]|uniref:hypothetical protein n=1 Tax=Paraburkholderia sp. BCC1885 TaxID=2562669 RepID=UPI0011843726|nr:hypothetical protein [Paraburkholderia sp. BCC1885]